MKTNKELRLAAADVLSQSADYLDENGWIQGTFHQTESGKTKACAVGAIRLVSGVTKPETLPGDFGDGFSSEQYAVYQKAMQEFTQCVRSDFATKGWGLNYASIIGWNDFYERESDEVTAEFRVCAERIRRDVAGEEQTEEASS